MAGRELAALLLCGLAALLSLVAIVLPDWSASTERPKPAFTAGVWGLCLHGPNVSLNNCFGYNRAADYNISRGSIQGVCEMYNGSPILATAANISVAQFHGFMDLACGGYGTATLVIAGFGVALAQLALLSLVLHMTIFKRKIAAALFVTQTSEALSGIFGTMAVCLWAAMASGLDGIIFSVAFGLQIVAIVLAATATVLLTHDAREIAFAQLPKD
ncbi:hypothetical protein ACHHYP_00853 [Achlya hypogyna]|uniref:Secreted protein n=1 Tax=Achlya hypogyna TaxID=1202772 RepID=A0A1V9ZA63_ACHHY|nr:hypothetical protein ACHHYP_00853 [Achlya hypogyna]